MCHVMGSGVFLIPTNPYHIVGQVEADGETNIENVSIRVRQRMDAHSIEPKALVVVKLFSCAEVRGINFTEEGCVGSCEAFGGRELEEIRPCIVRHFERNLETRITN